MTWAQLGSKRQGLAGIGAAIAFFTGQGHLVNMPLNDSQDYDMIVDDGQSLKKVQVKTTRYRSKSNGGRYNVCLKSSGGTKGSVYGRVGEGNAELLFVHTESGENILGSNPRTPTKFLERTVKMKNFCTTITILISAIIYVVAESIEQKVEYLFN